MKEYKSYKKSGVDWIGDIPEQWTTTKLKFHTNKIIDGAHLTPTYVDNADGIPFLRVTDIHEEFIDLNNVKKIPLKEHQELYKRCNPQKGDLLLSKNGTIGLMKIIDWEWEFSIFVSLCLIKFRSSLKNSFFYYFFKSNVVDQQISESSQKTSVTNLHLEKIKELRLTLPPLEEQTIIANYLDHKTSQLDTLISKKEKLIELLQEECTAIINQAVTKGLVPDVPMKDSGIEWLGEIPEHWDVKKIKHVTVKIGSGVTPRGGAEVYQDSGVPLLRSQNVYFDGFKLDDVAYISEEIHNSMSGSKVYPSDVLINITGGSIGRCFYVTNEFEEANVNQHVCIVRPNSKIETKYLYNLLRSSVGQLQIDICQIGGNRESLNFEQIKNFYIPLPSTREQGEILTIVKKREIEINSIIAKTKQEIELLKEYKTALVSEVVTGKVDVRNEALN